MERSGKAGKCFDQTSGLREPVENEDHSYPESQLRSMQSINSLVSSCSLHEPTPQNRYEEAIHLRKVQDQTIDFLDNVDEKCSFSNEIELRAHSIKSYEKYKNETIIKDTEKRTLSKLVTLGEFVTANDRRLKKYVAKGESCYNLLTGRLEEIPKLTDDQCRFLCSKLHKDDSTPISSLEIKGLENKLREFTEKTISERTRVTLNDQRHKMCSYNTYIITILNDIRENLEDCDLFDDKNMSILISHIYLHDKFTKDQEMIASVEWEAELHKIDHPSKFDKESVIKECVLVWDKLKGETPDNTLYESYMSEDLAKLELSLEQLVPLDVFVNVRCFLMHDREIEEHDKNESVNDSASYHKSDNNTQSMTSASYHYSENNTQTMTGASYSSKDSLASCQQAYNMGNKHISLSTSTATKEEEETIITAYEEYLRINFTHLKIHIYKFFCIANVVDDLKSKGLICESKKQDIMAESTEEGKARKILDNIQTCAYPNKKITQGEALSHLFEPADSDSPGLLTIPVGKMRTFLKSSDSRARNLIGKLTPLKKSVRGNILLNIMLSGDSDLIDMIKYR